MTMQDSNDRKNASFARTLSNWKARAPMRVLTAFAIGLVTASLTCQSVQAAETDTLPNIVCTFQQGSSWSFDAGAFKSTTMDTLSFEIADIDLEGLTATLVVKAGNTGGLRIVRALNANHFLEGTREGFLNLTTIYDPDPETGVYPAVHSRHQGVLGQPLYGQYTGTCKATASDAGEDAGK